MDLKGFVENIKTYFPVIREKVFDIIVEGNVRYGFFNYDTTNGRFQLKDAKCKGAGFLTDLDLIDCKIKNSKMINCNLYGCEIKDSEVVDSQITNSNKVYNSKLHNTSADYGNLLDSCYIDSPRKMINCEVSGGVIRKADIGSNAQISKETEEVKGFSDIRQSRFITDSRLKNLNDPINRINFKNQNY